MIRQRVAAVCAVLLILVAAHCGGTPDEAALQAQFDQAEQLCLDRRYPQARQLLKELLLEKPLHPGAHFYLARTYMASRDLRETGLAEYEFQLALRLFQQQDRTSGIERFDPRYFEMMCQLDSANSLLTQAHVLAQDATLVPLALDSLRRATEYVERGRTVNPKASEVDIVGEPIRAFAAQLARAHR